MVSMMLRFATQLRHEGLSVPTSSLHTAIQALEWIDLMNESQVYAALESCLVQNMAFREKFAEVFNKFFKEKTMFELEGESAAFKLQLQEFTNNLRDENDYVSTVLADFLEGDVRQVLENVADDKQFRAVYSDVTSGIGMSKERTRKEILKRISVLADQANDFANVSFHLPKEKREKLSEHIREQLEAAAELLKEKTPKRKSRDYLLPWEKQRAVSNISFDNLTVADQEKVKHEVERIAQKLNDTLSRQKKRARRGHLDIKNTIRHSMKFSGIPFNIKTRTPARKKGKIVALCDISMSVSHAAQFMLLLLYRLQNRFTRIRSFVFIRNAFEISHLFEKYAMEAALEKAVKQHHIGMGQLTNYGKSFKSFLDRYSSALTKDTTLLILGDALNNYIDPQVEDFKKMSEKVLRTYWLNPEQEKYWYSSGSAIMDYKPHCTQLVECATVEQLSDFARNLVL